jgi:hypothetical protein
MTEEAVMLTELRVLKPFVFTHPADEHTRITAETRFTPGIHRVVPEIANHPWIKAGADGRIESAAKRTERERQEAERKAAVDADNAIETAKAEAAVGRIAAAEATSRSASKEEIEKELNTPVSELRKRGAGADVNKAGR